MRHWVLAGLTAAGVLIGGTVLAQSPGIVGQKPSDVTFTEKGLESVIAGALVRFYDGSVAQYYRDRSYVYTAGDGRTSYRGLWEVYDGGQICVRFENGFTRCDTYVRSANKMILIEASGTRYPVRSKISLQ
ncbi:MAG: hypothetical protein KDA50_13885 [Rhodobacteraceae bacterium]|nr:hypothetical protein [Paracoccaceae bacterium]